LCVFLKQKIKYKQERGLDVGTVKSRDVVNNKNEILKNADAPLIAFLNSCSRVERHGEHLMLYNKSKVWLVYNHLALIYRILVLAS
jgi:hypothetical protein